jgi:WD40 repeat protein
MELHLPKMTLPINRQRKGVKIIDIKSIDHLKVLMVATDDKTMSLHDFEEFRTLVTFSVELGGFNLMEYFESYQVLLVAGFENTVKVFTITPDHFEINCIGRLVGHVSIISAVAPIEGTAMVVTCDDKGYAKIWDIRTLGCVQTVTLANKSNINHIAWMSQLDKVSFIGDRINCFEFENLTEDKAEDKVVALSCGLNENTNELFIITRNEVRVLDYYSGRSKIKFINVMDKEKEDEFTCFRMVPKKNQLMLGDFIGRVCLFNASSGDIAKISCPHSNSVSSIYMDFENNLLVSASLDSTVKVQVEKDLIAEGMNKQEDVDERKEFFSQPMLFEEEGKLGFQRYKRDVLKNHNEEVAYTINKESEEKFEGDTAKNIAVIKEIEECNGDSEIYLMDVSPFHNVFALASSSSRVWIYNYEYLRPASKVDLDPANEITNISFINGYAKLLICTSLGMVHILGLEFEANNKLQVYYDMRIDIRLFTFKNEQSQKVNLAGYINKVAMDMNFKEVRIEQSKPLSTFSPSKNKTVSLVPSSLEIYLGESSGVVVRLDFDEYLSKERTYENYSKNTNFNPLRNIKENFQKAVNTLPNEALNLSTSSPRKSFETFKKCFLNAFKAARDSFTHLELLKSKKRMVMLTSQDSTFRIFSAEGEMLCHLNLNHPLPIMWKVTPENLVNNRANVIFALKLVELLNQRYNKPDNGVQLNLQKIVDIYSKNDFHTFSMTAIDSTDARKDSINLADKSSISATPAIRNQPASSIQGLTRSSDYLPSITPVASSTALAQRSSQRENLDRKIKEALNKKRVILMKDIYTPKDLAYEQIKKMNREDIIGATLKQLDSIRRAKNVLKMSDPINDIVIDQDIIEKGLAEEKKLMRQPLLGKVEHPLEDILRGETKQKSLASRVDQSMQSLDRETNEKTSVRMKDSEQHTILGKSERRLNAAKTSDYSKAKIRQRESSFRGAPATLPSASQSNKSQFNPPNIIEASSVHLPSLDLFEYAAEKNLIQEDEYSAMMTQRSKILNENHDQSRVSIKQSVIDRKLEQHKFHEMLKQMNNRVVRAKAKAPTHLMADIEASLIESSGRPEQDFSVFSTQPSRIILPSVSLPRLRKY